MPALAQNERVDGEIHTLLGRGSEFEGKFTFEGTVRIDGKFKGEIFSDDVLVVGESAEIAAEIDVGVIIVEGRITGNVRAKRAVELRASAQLRGNLETPSLSIDKGVMFEGNCRMDSAGTNRASLTSLPASPKPPISK